MSRDYEADLAVCNAATPGPWLYDLDGSLACIHNGNKGEEVTGFSVLENNANFIAMAREELPWYIVACMTLEEVNKQIISRWDKEKAENQRFKEAFGKILASNSATYEIARIIEDALKGEKK